LPLDSTCYALVRDGLTWLDDWRLGLIEVRRRRFLVVESVKPVQAGTYPVPILSRCEGPVPIRRVVTIEVLPPARTVVPSLPPNTAPAPAPAPMPLAGRVDEFRYALPGASLVTRVGDHFVSLAQRLAPNDEQRRRQFLAALRAHNPALAGVGDSDALPADTVLILPDLKSLSGIVPAQTFGAGSSVKTAMQPKPPKPPVTPKPMQAGRVPTVRKAALDVPVASAKSAAPPIIAQPTKNADKPNVIEPASAATEKTSARPSRWLKLSSPELDLSPTRTTSDAQRQALRERRAILDADDQMAAMLALQNAVRQLESRLASLEKQSPQSAQTSARVDATALKPVPSMAVPATGDGKHVSTPAAPVTGKPSGVIEVPSQPPVAPPIAESGANSKPIAPTPAVAPVPAAPSAPSAPTAKRAVDARPAAGDAPLIDPLHLAGALGLLGLLVGLWAWSRRSTRWTPPAAALNDAKSAPALRQEPQVEHDGLRDEAGAQDPGPSTQSNDAEPLDASLDVDPHAQTQRMSATDGTASVVIDETPARFDLDPTPASNLDLSLDDRPDEDRVRRLQYMYERFPELMSRTVSLDEADTVINAARLYYEEGQVDRACELLTFGVEERPQETRFWLAQFEIFRLEQMRTEFVSLASKFHVLFSYSPSWPKVRQIGHELDPANPLFAAGRDVLGTDAFDPVAENWLNSPMDFTADALMSDLRRDLFEQHNVDRTDFDALPGRLGQTGH
jgi:hypothetical protein